VQHLQNSWASLKRVGQ